MRYRGIEIAIVVDLAGVICAEKREVAVKAEYWLNLLALLLLHSDAGLNLKPLF